jgi:hypothetical protein
MCPSKTAIPKTAVQYRFVIFIGSPQWNLIVSRGQIAGQHAWFVTGYSMIRASPGLKFGEAGFQTRENAPAIDSGLYGMLQR